jgi:ribA/ribD-fused uncharacterized protein
MQIIAFTKVALSYGWLSNMAPYPVTYAGLKWKTTEALFQALRFGPDDSVRDLIREQKSPMTAKMIAKKHASRRIVTPMTKEDVSLMKQVLSLKLETYPDLQQQLLNTDDAFIVEDVTNRFNGTGIFWGARLLPEGIWDGNNALGYLWMELRDELRVRDGCKEKSI